LWFTKRLSKAINFITILIHHLKMNNKILIFSLVTFAFISMISCKDKQTQSAPSDIVKSTAANKDGQKLEMTFDNAKGTATVQYNGETIELTTDNPASGMSYKNDHYQLMGKGEYVEFSKDGNLIFKSDDPFYEEQSGNNGQQWWMDQHLINGAPISKNPEEGGESFLKINADSTAEYKVGDIVNTMTWTEEDHALLLKNKLSGKILKFKITSNTLIDDFGQSWFVKK